MRGAGNIAGSGPQQSQQLTERPIISEDQIGKAEDQTAKAGGRQAAWVAA